LQLEVGEHEDAGVKYSSLPLLRHGCRSGAPMDGFTAWQGTVLCSCSQCARNFKRHCALPPLFRSLAPNL